MGVDIKGHIAERISNAGSCYAGDLQAMSEELLGRSPGGVARTPYDFTYEVIFVNRRLATRIKGEDPGPANVNGWIVAPEEYKNKERILSDFNESVQQVLSAWNGLAEDQLEREIPLPQGDPTSPIKLASLCASHITYHDAQLNYIQAMQGDGEMHWD